MATPVLSTKLYTPKPRSDLVIRNHLLDLLHQAIFKKLILVSAPAGFGKTTLLSAWTQETEMSNCWVSLDIEDSDPVHFLIYLISALQNIASEVGQASLTLLHSNQPTAINTIIVMLINELSKIQGDFALILDDYHAINSQEIHEAIGFLIDNLPQHMHLIISSRSDPPLQLSRLRVRDQLTEIRQSDLRFSREEAAEFLSQCVGLELSNEQVNALEIRTEGWIAGLQLAGLSLKDKKDTAAFIKDFSGSHRFVIDYLFDEVVSNLPNDLSLFLQHTSVLDRFTASLCDDVTGRSDSAMILKGFEEANLFLIPLDDHREWYRYHHLFSDFLRYQLDDESGKILHQKAARWFGAKGLYSEAVKHALESEDLETAAQTIVTAAPEVFNQGAINSLMGWLNSLPESYILRNSELAIYKGFTFIMSGAMEGAIPYVTAAEQNLPENPPSGVFGRLLSLKAQIALCNSEMDETIHLSREALEYLDEQDLSIRNLTLNILGQVLELKGDVVSASKIYAKAFETGWQTGDVLGALVIFTNLILSLNEIGKRQEAVIYCDQMKERLNGKIISGLPLVDSVNLPLSILSLEANEIEAALEQVNRAITFMTTLAVMQGAILGKYILARILLANKSFSELSRVVQEGLQIAKQIDRESLYGVWLTALEVDAHLSQQNLTVPNRWVEERDYSIEDTPIFYMEFPYFTYVRWLIANRKFTEAEKLLSNMADSAKEGGRIRKLITVHLLQAHTSLGRNERETAVKHIEQALILARPSKYIRAFLDEGPEIAQLLPSVREIAPVFVDEISLAFGAEITPPIKSSIMMDALSERELEVLSMVAKGHSNREIADALYVTLGTVKKHLNNVFSKLQVKSRTQAVVKGRELDLL